MKYEILFDGGRLVKMLIKDPLGRKEKVLKVLSTRQASTLLRRTRRQIYRYIAKGVLRSYGPFLGDWLFEKDELLFLKRVLDRRKGRLGIPSHWQVLFPEYRLRDLLWREDADLILGRVLNLGGRKDYEILFKVYSEERIQYFLRERGSRDLTSKSLNFLCWFFKIPSPRLASSTRLGQVLGGVG